MFFGFQLTLGLMMAFYGFSVIKNPRVWGDQGRRAVKAENFEEYCRQNGQFFLKAGCVLAFAFYPLTRWCKQNEGFSWPWPHVQSEKKRIKELRREQQAQENEEKGEK